jgi:hypothetical protein
MEATVLPTNPKTSRAGAMQNRMANERLALDRIYSILRHDVAIKMNVAMLKEALGGNIPGIENFVSDIARLGILDRDVQWKAKGKVSFWKLAVSKEEAFKRLEDAHQVEINNSVVFGNGDSLKSRIIAAFMERGKFETVEGLIDYIKEPKKAAPTPHEVTHILHSLVRQSKIKMRKGTMGARGKTQTNGKAIRKSSDEIPYNMEWRNWKAPTKTEIKPVVAQIDDPEPTITEPVKTLIKAPVQFPLINSLVSKTTRLLALAEAAEDAGQDDIALMLMERAEIKDPFQLEVIQLWNAYQECKNGN